VREIAAAAGVSVQTVNRVSLRWGGTVKATSADKILTIHPNRKPERHSPRELVDATGTIRRLQALVYMGYPAAELMRKMDTNPSYAYRMMTHPLVIEATRIKVAELFDDIWNVEPTAHTAEEAHHIRRARIRAREQGWVGPLGWEDIDDPNEEPDRSSVVDIKGPSNNRIDEDAIESSIRGEKPRLSPRERREVITVLNERRWSARQIGDHIGCAARTVDRVRKELGLPIYLSNNTHHRDGTLAA
jgi:hypothetical protein